MKENSMITTSLFKDPPHNPADIQHALSMIELKLDLEIASKQKTIELQELEIQRLHALTEDKNSVILQLTDRLTECTRNSEGSRQLTNKLLNDIDRLQQDIEWYKKTYETRSFLGTIKQKLFRKRL